MKTHIFTPKFIWITFLFILYSNSILAQQINVTGTVIGTDDEPIIGVSILVKGTTQGVITDLNGNYTINTNSDATLVFSYVGCITQEVAIAGRKKINITLVEDSKALDEVVVIGYAVGNKRSVSGAVDRVTAKDMNLGYIATPIDAIRGKVPGMVISQDGGNVNAEPTVRIRGTSSLSGGNDPLVIIDGVFGSLEMLNTIAAQDIEEVTVLKDASETAQYGSRGAAGVIVVTTAKGKEGVSNITYNGQFGISHAYKQLQMLSPNEWRHVNQTLFSGVGKDLGASTNWMDWVQNSVYTQNNHTVSLTQATKKGSMRATFGINDRTGVSLTQATKKGSMRATFGINDRTGSVRNTGNTTYYGRFNSNLHGLNNKLSLEFNLSAIYRESKPGSNVWSSAAVYNPTYPSERNPETGIWDIDNNVSSMVVHPGEIMEYDLKNESTRINASARATYKIIDGLSLSAFGSFMYVNTNNKAYYPNDVYAYRGNRGRAQVSNRHGKDWMGNIQANYSKEFNKHAINALALVEGQSYYTFNSSVYTEGFDTNYFKYNNLAAGALLSYGNASSGAQKNTLLSYMARLNYMFDNKYVITVNARTDGSSKLGANHKWGFFPSASAAWIISNEEFMKKQKIFSTLKLRAGYGVTGNQDAISPLNSLQVLSPNGISSYNNQSVVTYAVASNANPDLKWETKYTFDIGLDFTMFNGRLRGTMDYFHSTTKDLLYTYNVSVPPFTYPTLLANMGEMVNKGFEFSISGEVIKNKKWGLNLSGNVSFLKNKLISLSGAYNGEALTTTDWVVVSSAGGSGLTANTAVTYMAEGYPVGIFRLPVHDGFNQASDGKKTYKFKDLDGDGTIDHSDSGDREILGQVVPKVNMNLNAQLRYKQFDLSVQFNGAFGHKIYNATHLNYNNLNLFPSYNVLKTAPNLGIYDIVHTSYWLEKGDYVNIEYITLGYNIPTKVFKIFSNARIALSCNNVATITGYSGLTPMINSASFQGGVDSRKFSRWS